MPHVTFTRDFRLPGAPYGYFAVQTKQYFAVWSLAEPDLVAVHTSSGEGLPLLTLRVGGELEFADGKRLESGSVSPEGVDLLQKQSLSREWAGGGESAGEFRVPFRGTGDLAWELLFAEDRIELKPEITLKTETRIRSLTLSAGSDTTAAEIVNPCSNSTGIHRYAPDRPLCIRPDWFTPPPFCYCYVCGERCFTAALEAPAGQQSFSRFLTLPDPSGRQRWKICYDSLPAFPAGKWSCCGITFRFGKGDAYDALALHRDGMIGKGFAPKLDRVQADWQKQPMVCGWFHQCQEAEKRKVSAMKVCTQAIYEDLLALLEEKMIRYGTLIIDAGWSRTLSDWRPDPERWHDLPGFADRLHAAGKKVLLWLSPNVPGLPEEEIYEDATGQKIADPLNHRWRKRVEDGMKIVFGQCHADGIKFDFTDPIPRGPRKNAGTELHGLDYLLELFRLFHDAAKRENPACLLDFQVAHPVFAGYCDMSRLNDFFLEKEQAVRVMEHRAKVASAVGQGVLIDTDCPVSAEYYETAVRFGVRSLYLSRKALEEDAIVRVLSH